MNFNVFMLSNRPDMAMKSLKHYSAFDTVYVFAHEDQKEDFEMAYEECFPIPNVKFLFHSIARLNGDRPPLGSIRYHLMRRAQELMGRRDIAIQVDDDLKQPRYAEPDVFRKNGDQSYPNASPKIFRNELERVATEARSANFSFFSGIFNAMGHNGYNPKHPFKAVWTMSMLLGFFKSSLNPFDPRIAEGEDYAACCTMVEKLKTLPILQHRGLVPEFEILSQKYRSDDDPRNKILRLLRSEYPWLELRNNYRSRVIAPRMNRVFLNRLKKTVGEEYR